MTRIFSLIFFLAGLLYAPAGAFGQEEDAQKLKRDSLEFALPGMPLDTTKIKSLDRLARLYFASDKAKSEQYMIEAIKLSQKIRSDIWRVKSQELLAQIYSLQYKYAEAAALYSDLLEYYEKTGQKLKTAGVCSQLGNNYRHLGELNKALEYQLKSLKIAEEIKNNELIGTAYNSLGMIYSGLHDDLKTIAYYHKFEDLSLAAKDTGSLATAYNNLSDSYMHQGDFAKTVEYGYKAMNINLILKSNGNLITNYATMGEAYERLNQLDSAYHYVQLCFDLSLKEGDIYSQAYAYNDMARVLIRLGKGAEAVKNLKESEHINQEAKSAELQLLICKNFVKAYTLQSNYKEAMRYQTSLMNYNDSVFTTKMSSALAQAQTAYDTDKKQKEIAFLKTEQEVQAKNQRIILASAGGIILSILVIAGMIYRNKKKEEKQNALLGQQNEEIKKQKDQILDKNAALESIQEEILSQNEEITRQKGEVDKSYANIRVLSEIGQKITAVLRIKGIVETVYAHVNSLMDASGFGIGVFNKETNSIEFEGFIENGSPLPDFSDSLSGKNHFSVWCLKNNKAVFINNLQVEYSSYLQDWNHEAEGLTPKSLIYVPLEFNDKVIGVLTVQSFKENSYTEQDLTVLSNLASYISIALDNAKAYKVIRQKNMDITDSIRYAQTIQEAVFPSEKRIEAYFNDFFVLAKPKDIVSGDFYWFINNGGRTFVAVVDCTGHGVPGAFMSMIGLLLLNEIVNFYDIFDPETILEKLDKGVRDALHQEDDHANADGMDVCLCVVEDLPGGGKKIDFAGAKRPLLYSQNGVLNTLKGTNKAIGGSSNKKEKPFEKQTITLAKGDCFYLTSDGYADQNDIDRKKFGTVMLYKLLAENMSRPMPEQKTVLEKALEQHSQGVPQRDDITLLGFKI